MCPILLSQNRRARTIEALLLHCEHWAIDRAFQIRPPISPFMPAEFRNPGRRSVGPHTRVMVVRPPQRREVPAEVQFEIARNAVTDITELCAARLRAGPGQGR